MEDHARKLQPDGSALAFQMPGRAKAVMKPS
jgi:hypothetical protein